MKVNKASRAKAQTTSEKQERSSNTITNLIITQALPPCAGLKAHKLPAMVAPTDKTDYQFCKAGMKAANVIIAENTYCKQ